MAAIAVPGSLTLRQMENWRLVTETRSPGRGLDGWQQFITTENRSWACTYRVDDAWEWGGSSGAYMAFLDQLRGPAGTFSIPVPNFNRGGYGLTGPLFVFNASNMAFEDGQPNALVLNGDADLLVAVAAPAGAQIIQTQGGGAAVLQPGSFFSWADYLYRVQSVSGAAVTFNPPLRSPVSIGTKLSVNTPKIRVRLPDDEAAAAAHKFSAFQGDYMLTVVEAFQR